MRRIFINLGAGSGDDIKGFYSLGLQNELAEVYAFEANPQRTEGIKKRFPNITVYTAAAGIEDTKTKMYLGKNLNTSSLNIKKVTIEKDRYIEVDVIDLCRWMKENFSEQDYITMIMDIEGGEYELVDNLRETGMIDWNKVFKNVSWFHWTGITPAISKSAANVCLEGLKIALDNLDEVIKIIRASKNPQEANIELRKNFALTDIQAKAILEMRLQKLTGLERDKIDSEYNEIVDKIAEFRVILSDKERQTEIIKIELDDLLDRYGDERRTQIVYSAEDFSVEDMIADEDVVVTISNKGFIKRMPLSGYRRQRRGGKGMKGTTTREEEYVEHLFVATNHNYILFFTEKGKCYWLKVYEIPEGGRLARGRAIVNLIEIEKEDAIKAFVPVKSLDDEEYLQNKSIVMCSVNGQIKKTSLEAYSRPRRDGIIAISIKDGDSLLGAELTDGESNIILANSNGRAIRFHETDVRQMGRNTSGVRGMTLGKGDELVDMVVIKNTHEATVLAISENGFGKRSLVDDYREQSRGGKGVITLKTTPKTGGLIALKEVSDQDDLMVITQRGKVIRMNCGGIRTMGRNTQGVRIMRLDSDGSIAAVTRVVNDEEDGDPGEAED